MNTLKITALFVLLFIAEKTQAQITIPVADVSLKFASSSSNSVKITLSGLTLAEGSTYSRNVLADPFKILPAGITVVSNANVTTGLTPTEIASSALWFCLDPLQTIVLSPGSGNLVYQSDNPDNFNVWNANSSTSGGGGITAYEKTALENLFKRYFVAAAADNTGFTAAALQIAVWEVVNEKSPTGTAGVTPYSVFTGNFTASNLSGTASTLLSMANSMLTNRETAVVTSVGTLDFLIDGKYNTTLIQDMVGWEKPIPESSNFAVGALGLLAVGVVVRLRNRKAKTMVLVGE